MRVTPHFWYAIFGGGEGRRYAVRKGSVRKYPITCISYTDIVFYFKNDNF